MSGWQGEIATQHRVAPRSIISVVMTITGRSCSPRGVPLPISWRMTSPRLKPPRMNQQALEDIGVTAQVGAAHTASVIEMRKGAFDPLAPLTHQAPAARATNPPPI